ncbi:helix-turn-helix transcriptional regulator [Nocardioides sp.]|uniref:helix-turn-helix transcriptional regulator n=1 Tax=Nocardioides sp. TaxID=35761 RepID=UPI0035145D0B
MPAPKSERLLNLLILLLVQRRPLPKERIRALLYADSRPEAFEKMFERDKEELRSLGVPVDVEVVDAFFDDEVGYRIAPEAYALPDVELSAEEAAVVGLASRVWQHASVAQAATAAVRKLVDAEPDPDPFAGPDAGPDAGEPGPVDDAPDLAPALIGADDPAFEVCWRAACERRAIVFDYRRPAQDSPSTRHLQPWGVVRSSGRWYVVGHDTDRKAERVFRLSRIVGTVRPSGPADAFTIPVGTDIRETARRLAPPPATEQAALLVREGAGGHLRAAASRVVHGVQGPDDATAWDRIEVRRPASGLADEVLALGADAVLLEPASIRDEIVSRLRAVVA